MPKVTWPHLTMKRGLCASYREAYKPHSKERYIIFFQEREQTDVIRNTIYHTAFFTQGHKMAAIALAILSKSRQKVI